MKLKTITLLRNVDDIKKVHEAYNKRRKMFVDMMVKRGELDLKKMPEKATDEVKDRVNKINEQRKQQALGFYDLRIDKAVDEVKLADSDALFGYG